MSRFQYTNRNLELLEPYEWKRSRTVLRGESGSNAADLPDRPSDLEQRVGRAVRKGNEIAKLYADNKVDIVVYAVERSLDSYKFNLLHNKQLFIQQLKSGNLAARTIDEGAMDDKTGMPFSEYVAILSGNTDLLEKAKVEKKIAVLESERQAFSKNKAYSEYKFAEIKKDIDSAKSVIDRLQSDNNTFNSTVQKDRDGSIINQIKLKDFDKSDLKLIGLKLNEINANTDTKGNYYKVGILYGFNILVKTDGTNLIRNETGELKSSLSNYFYIEGEGNIKYHFNNGRIASDPILAANNFINALQKIPSLIEKYKAEVEKLSKDVPILKDVCSKNWGKDSELQVLKSEMAAIDRKIQLSIKPVENEQIEKKIEVKKEGGLRL